MGETGSGKTTQIPQYLHEAGYTKRGKVQSFFGYRCSHLQLFTFENFEKWIINGNSIFHYHQVQLSKGLFYIEVKLKAWSVNLLIGK